MRNARLAQNIVGLLLGGAIGLAVTSPTVQALGMLPMISILSPADGTDVSGTVSFYAAADSAGLVSLQFRLDGSNYGPPITSGSCQANWDSKTVPDGPHTIDAVGVDQYGSTTMSQPTTVFVNNTAPTISNVAVSNVLSDGATITWTTSQSADGAVDYGTTTGYGLSSAAPTVSTTHAVILAGLTPATTYHFRAKSKTSQNLIATSADFSLTTAGVSGDTTPPPPSPPPPAPTCTQVAPTVSLSPADTVRANAGASVAYNVSIMNNDFGSCDSDTFSLSSVIPAGWNAALAATSLRLPPGGAGTTGMTLSSASSANGTYNFSVNSARSIDNSSATGTIQIAGNLGLTLNVSVDAQFAQFSSTATAGGAPVPGLTVTFTVVNPLGKTATLSATTDSRGVARTKLRMKFKDQLGVYQVTASVSLNGSTVTATGSFVR